MISQIICSAIFLIPGTLSHKQDTIGLVSSLTSDLGIASLFLMIQFRASFLNSGFSYTSIGPTLLMITSAPTYSAHIFIADTISALTNVYLSAKLTSIAGRIFF